MIAVILAGGKGTRLAEETQVKPKPLVEACGNPLIWHIMNNYARFGITEFIVLVGYRGHMIREYFANYWLNSSDVTFNMTEPKYEVLQVKSLPWKVTVLDSGLDTLTGGRVLRLKKLINEDFLLTYGDGVSDVDISKVIEQHKISKNIVTLTAAKPPARFGAIEITEGKVTNFQEKPEGEGSWVNAGFFVVSPKVFDYIDGDNSSFESETLTKLSKENLLGAYQHLGLWQPVDTIRDLEKLNEIIREEGLPWL